MNNADQWFTLILSVVLFCVGYGLGHADGKLSGWVDGYCDRPFGKNKEQAKSNRSQQKRGVAAQP